MLENQELNKFYTEIQEDIKTQLISEEEGANPEQIFTDFALALLSDAGETENCRVCYDEKISKRGVEHKVNAYSLYENYETLDLFVTIYNADNTVQSVTKTEAEKAIERLSKFFRNAVYKDYVNELEESSEIFDLAQTLANVEEVKEFLTRVNIFLLTNGEIKSDLKISDKIAGYPVFYRIVDINYLFNLSEKSRIPIEIDFKSNGGAIPCIGSQSDNKDYQSYLAIIPGISLASIYEQFGSRLLEQNVRSFLQFTGKINKGIRRTILEEPQMFLAFNNGIAATAEEVKIIELPNGAGKAIDYIKDFQIVNGGQTTASIYHTWRKGNADISKVFVQLKLTIIKDQNNFAEIVSSIAEYANTQNRVSASDLSSNREHHIILEKLSRTVWAPPKAGETYQTHWFYERSRGQYKNERMRYGITPSRRKQFDKQNPRSQMFTKELLAKYVNAYKEVYYGKKLVIGPHVVVRGSQKNYAQFLNYNFEQKPDNIYFEDAVALAVLFNTAEKLYGVKPNSIGDMRYITVPYSIAWMGYKLNYQLDLYRIWRAQELSASLKEKLYEIMTKIEGFIKDNAPGSLYGEWAKKEECWVSIRETDLDISFNSLKDDLASNITMQRRRISDDQTAQAELEASIERIRSIHPQTWKKIENWGKAAGNLSQYQINMAYSIGNKVGSNRKFSDIERIQGNSILDIIADQAPELFFDMEKFFLEDENAKVDEPEITLELIKEIAKWDKKNKRLQPFEYRFMVDLAEGKKDLTDRNKFIAKLNFEKAKKYGFRV